MSPDIKKGRTPAGVDIGGKKDVPSLLQGSPAGRCTDYLLTLKPRGNPIGTVRIWTGLWRIFNSECLPVLTKAEIDAMEADRPRSSSR